MERFGLCDTCRHQRLVRTGRGSLFSMCLRSKDDTTFAKYPRVPVVACHGYERHEPAPPAGAASEHAVGGEHLAHREALRELLSYDVLGRQLFLG
jgi:hypothetical protein